MNHLFIRIMVRAIHFYNQVLFQAYKINYIVINNMLTFELYTKCSTSQLLPQAYFCRCLVTAILTCKNL